MLKRPFPIVSARSVKEGPKVPDVREYVPVPGSNVYVNPPDGVPRGKADNWDTIA
jgi:hypothetical protein